MLCWWQQTLYNNYLRPLGCLLTYALSRFSSSSTEVEMRHWQSYPKSVTHPKARHTIDKIWNWLPGGDPTHEDNLHRFSCFYLVNHTHYTGSRDWHTTYLRDIWSQPTVTKYRKQLVASSRNTKEGLEGQNQIVFLHLKNTIKSKQVHNSVGQVQI